MLASEIIMKVNVRYGHVVKQEEVMRSEYFFYSVNAQGEKVYQAVRVACVDEILYGFIDKYRDSLLENRIRIRPVSEVNIGIEMGCRRAMPVEPEGELDVRHWEQEYRLYEQMCMECPMLFAVSCSGHVITWLGKWMTLLEDDGKKRELQEVIAEYQSDSHYAPQALPEGFWNYWETLSVEPPATTAPVQQPVQAAKRTRLTANQVELGKARIRDYFASLSHHGQLAEASRDNCLLFLQRNGLTRINAGHLKSDRELGRYYSQRWKEIQEGLKKSAQGRYRPVADDSDE